MEMNDREKVMWSLARCSCGVPDACSDCYYDNYPPRICVQHLTSDALALLKAQKPRVMTLEEYKAWMDIPFCERDPILLEMKSRRGTETWWTNTAEFSIENYGKTERCWTSRPDEKVRQETPWE